MTELILPLIAFLLLIIAIIWWHFVRSARLNTLPAVSLRDETNVRLYHEHKAEIENDYKEGNIDEENYQYLIAELEKGLLQDIEQNTDEQLALQQNSQVKAKSLSVAWPILITVFVLGFSGLYYLKNGAYQQVNEAKEFAENHANNTESAEQQILARIKEIQTKLTADPENSDLWYDFGQILVGVGEFENALQAFDRVIAIEGESAEVLGVKAQATYYQNKQQINENVQTLIDKALALDPGDPSTNILLGMDNFINQQYQQAITYWQKIVDENRENVNVVALNEAIVEAKNRLSLTSKDQAKQSTGALSEVIDEGGPQLILNVSVSDDIAQLLSEGDDKVVFVYAIAAKGSRMPLAAVKIMASDLPTTITLNNTKAMTPQANLSSVEQVNIYAVVSHLGSVGIKSGDYKAEKSDISVNIDEPMNLIIDVVVP